MQDMNSGVPLAELDCTSKSAFTLTETKEDRNEFIR